MGRTARCESEIDACEWVLSEVNACASTQTAIVRRLPQEYITVVMVGTVVET